MRPRPALELIHRPPTGNAKSPPLLFVHGAYAAAWCWDTHFLPYFAEHGFDAYAVSLRGHGASEGRDWLSIAGIDDYVDDLANAVSQLPESPILIGHSMGGMVVQQYLQRHAAPAAVLMASVPPEGLLGTTLLLAFSQPEMLRELNLIHSMDGRPFNVGPIKRALFSDDMPDEQVLTLLARFQPESHRALLDLSFIPFRFPMPLKCDELLVLGAEDDAFFPPSMVRATAKRYGVEEIILPGLAHTIMLERNWRTAAEAIRHWLDHRTKPAA